MTEITAKLSAKKVGLRRLLFFIFIFTIMANLSAKKVGLRRGKWGQIGAADLRQTFLQKKLA